LWVGFGTGLVLVLTSGPIAWRLGGRRWWLLGVPLLIVPAWGALYVFARLT
jgi:hypothetical protein